MSLYIHFFTYSIYVNLLYIPQLSRPSPTAMTYQQAVLLLLTAVAATTAQSSTVRNKLDPVLEHLV